MWRTLATSSINPELAGAVIEVSEVNAARTPDFDGEAWRHSQLSTSGRSSGSRVAG